MRLPSSYPLGFAAGLLLANGTPHFIHGVSGDSFPTPFATPSGVGPSTPPVNVAWGLANLVGGYLLLRAARPNSLGVAASCFAGMAAVSFTLSHVFQKKQVAG